jgi:Ca2+-binding RTX toxin-like protein
VQSSVNYVLADNLENLQLTGLKNLKGTGNDGKNIITGNDGDNFLDGKNGFDTLKGGAGDDTLLGGGGVDQLVGGDGSDTYQVSSNEDRIVETAQDGTGNDLANIVEGNGGANQLAGEKGDDTLDGSGGNDTLDGGAGDDRIDGGAGLDQAAYLGEEDDYRIFFDADSDTWVVEDVNGEDGDGTDEGRDEITGVETLVFADGTLNLTKGLTLAIDNVTQAEGTGDADTAFDFTVTLSAASSAPVTVDYAVLAGTATAGTDFTAGGGTLSFAPGETARTISVPVKADRLIESNETFTVQLSNPVGATLAAAKGTGTIQNDDNAELSIAGLQVVEGNGGSQEAVLTVTLSSGATQAVTVDFATADGTAAAGSDYTAASGILTFAPGETSQQVKIPVADDTLAESDETFTIALSGAQNAAISDTQGSATVTLANDDASATNVVFDGFDSDLNDSANLVEGTEVNDRIGGLGGNDTLRGGTGNDSLTGGLGDDELIGGLGDDTLVGSEGDDSLDGGEGDDSLVGGAGNDTVEGGGGTDVINTGEGDDDIDARYSESGKVDAGAGNDFVNYYNQSDNDIISIDGGSGNDTIYGDGNYRNPSAVLNGGSGDDKIGFDKNGSRYSGNGYETIDGGTGNDSLNGGFDNDKILERFQFRCTEGGVGRA